MIVTDISAPYNLNTLDKVEQRLPLPRNTRMNSGSGPQAANPTPYDRPSIPHSGFAACGWWLAFVLAGALCAGAAEAGPGGVEPSAATGAAGVSAQRATAPAATRPLDGIMAIQDERGRTVYVNAPAPNPAKTAASMPQRTSDLVYWSNKEKQWKPVPPPSPSAMQAARNAAAEVMDYVQEKTASQTRTRKPPEAMPQAASQPSPARRGKSQNPAASAELRRETPAAGERPTAVSTPARNGHSGSWPANARYLVGPKEIDEAIERAAARHQVDPNLVRAMIKVESNFNPHAVSKKGAMGLMQLMPATARRLDVSHPFDPNENVDAGVRHLRNLLDNYGGNVRLSLAAYNAGETAVARYNGVPAIPETANYVKQITNLYAHGGPLPLFLSFTPRPGAARIRVFRDPHGVITMTNE